MISTSFLFVLFNISFLAMTCIFQTISGRTEEEDDLCAYCTNKINVAMMDVRFHVRQYDPIHVNFAHPCSKCTFSGLLTVGLAGEVCPEEVTGNGEQCYEVNIPFVFNRIEVDCMCTLPLNPGGVLNLLLDATKDPENLIGCKQIFSDISHTVNVPFEVSEVLTINPLTLLTTAECNPLPNTIDDPLLNPLPQDASIGLQGNYTNMRINVTIHGCLDSQNITIKDVFLYDSDPKDSSWTCLVDENTKPVEKSCECLDKSDYMHKLFQMVIKRFFPCYAKTKVSDMDNVLERLSCLSLVTDD